MQHTHLTPHLMMMPQATKNTSNSFNFSSVGDKVKQNRILLEKNLQQTDLSLHLSSLQGNNYEQNEPSVEYSRHVDGPTQADFSSFGFSPQDHNDTDSFKDYNTRLYGIFS
jgi:hypothetical protein